MKWLRNARSFKPFTEREAWGLFTAAAIGEAVGWTLLISGIVAAHFRLPGYGFMLPIAGQTHGVLFVFYLGIALSAGGSLGWAPWKILLAIAASVPPYGTLVFELWAARGRRVAQRRVAGQVVRAVIYHGDRVLAVQPSVGTAFCLPGGPVAAGETAARAIERMVTQLTGVIPVVGQPRMVAGSGAQRELHFPIVNAEAFWQLDVAQLVQSNPDIDELQFVDPSVLGNV